LAEFLFNEKAIKSSKFMLAGTNKHGINYHMPKPGSVNTLDNMQNYVDEFPS
jgi:hypothetical protein